ncbi:MAG TPA: FKBP-type peptidyl-prolyl cis-trans isomerase [Acidimicrobiales bacterium]|jgi:peptidylprolyl isomerase
MTSTPSSDRFTPGPVPNLDHATDLKMAPVVHPGEGEAPEHLVGADLVVGAGEQAAAGATVNVHYVGALFTTGEPFDSSWGRGATSFSLNQVIPGFSEGIVGMRVGGRRELVIPADLGYGSAGAPPVIPGGATLVFVVDLLGVS